jgi:hypothetical protein
LHPLLERLYLVGPGGNAVYSYPLSKDGEPLGSPIVFDKLGAIWNEVAVSPKGERLYLGTPNNQLEVIDLDSKGVPLPGTLRSFSAGDAPHAGGVFSFHYTPRALYRRHPLLPIEAGDPNDTTYRWNIPVIWPLYVWPLGENGYPVGAPEALEKLGRAEAIDPDGGTIWIAADDTFPDAVTHATITDGTAALALPLDAKGFPLPLERKGPTSYLQAGVLMEVAGNGQPVLLTRSMAASGFLGNQVSNFWLQVEVLNKDPLSKLEIPSAQASTSVDVQFGWTDDTGKTRSITLQKAVGTPSQPIPLTPYLQGKVGQVTFIVIATGFSLDDRKVQIKITSGPQATATLGSVTEAGVTGQVVRFLVRGYGFLAPGTEPPVIELMSEHAKHYLVAAQQDSVRPEDRPRQFIVSCYQLMGGQGHRGQLDYASKSPSDDRRQHGERVRLGRHLLRAIPGRR